MVDVKSGEGITSIAVGWLLEGYVKVAKAEEPKGKKKEGKTKEGETHQACCKGENETCKDIVPERENSQAGEETVPEREKPAKGKKK